MKQEQLQGKVAIITGASMGIGAACARLMAAQGASLVLTARHEGPLQEVSEEISRGGARAVALAGSVDEEDHAAALVTLAEREFGGVDIALNNAGVLGSMKTLPEISLEEWQSTLRTNLTSCFLAAKYQIPAMQKRGAGSLLFTGSFVGYTAGIPNTTDYAASKAGIVGLVQSLAAEVGSQNIRVNALLPGGTDTRLNHANLPGAGPEVQKFVEHIHALKRLAQPEEIAEAALFLASDKASFVTGSAMLVDGGVSVTKG